MKIRLSLLSLLAAPLLTVAQQAPPLIKGRPLSGSGALTLVPPAPPAPSTDPRVLDFAERFKAALGPVRDANPAVLPASPGKRASVARLQERAGGKIEIRMRHNTGTPRFIEGIRLESAAAVHSGGIEQQDLGTARNFLRANRELLRLTDPDNEMALEKSERDEIDRRHLRFVQKHKGIPVWPAHVGIHLDMHGSVYLMTGAYVPTPDIAHSKATITPEDAIKRGHIHVPAGNQHTEPELIIYAPGEQTPRLAWKVEISAEGVSWWVVVDAADGRILTVINQFASANVAGSGVDLFGQTRPLNVWQQGSSFFLVDTSKPMFDATSQPPAPQTTRGGLIVLDGRNQPPTSNVTETPPVVDITSPTATGFNIPQAVSAAFNVSLCYDYFQDRFQRNSFDNQGSNIYVLCRIGQNWQNADMSFRGGRMRFGDGDLYAGALDVVAHEFTHAVTGSTSDLVYQNQSGALNESFSDIFGEMIEFRSQGNNDWILGTLLQPGNRRSLKNPAEFDAGGRPFPTKMSEFFNLPNTPQGDNGGVHVNSSIHNHCYYLLAEGLQGGIGRADAEKIFYRALTTYLMPNSAFVDARLASVRSAKDLFGENSTQAQRTAAAFDAVEIFDTQGTPDPVDTPPVNAADSTLFIYGNQNTGFALARREAALNDPIEGRFLGNNFAVPRPPAANGAGSLAVYVTADNDISLLRTDGQGEQKLGFPGLVNSVSISPDGSRFGFVLRDSSGQPDNKISVIDVVTPNAQPVTYTLVAPGTDGGTDATIVFADTMAFTANGRFLIYDALDALQLASGPQVGVFSIYALELSTGNIQSLVQPIRDFNIGNPSLSKTNDNFMTFEAVRVDNGASTILAIELSSGNAAVVGNSNTLAFPTYTGGDDGIVFALANPNGAPGTGISLVRQAVGADRRTKAGDPTLWLQDGGYPFIYRRGAFQGPPDTSPITRLANISTRMRVLTGERVLIAGFIINGTEPKKVIIRGVGPSLSGVGGTLPNPFLRLRQGATTLAENDNWKQNQAEVEATTIPPTNDLESAIVTTLNPGTYTAVLEGTGGGTGIGVVEVYDLAQGVNSKLANISTRGFVDTGDNVMIGGLIVTQGTDAGVAKVLIRGLGPSLSGSGIQGPLQNPTLELRNANGTTTASNDNWKTRPDGSSQQAEIQATTIPPSDDLESAIVSTLVPGNYTAIMRGSGNSTGVALVEFYNIQ